MCMCVYVADPPVGKWEKWENGHFVRDKCEKVLRFVFSLILHDGIMGKAYKMHKLYYKQNLNLNKIDNGEKYEHTRRDTKDDG
jgi:hypothetical protein